MSHRLHPTGGGLSEGEGSGKGEDRVVDSDMGRPLTSRVSDEHTGR
jgi:hypothetical protein